MQEGQTEKGGDRETAKDRQKAGEKENKLI